MALTAILQPLLVVIVGVALTLLVVRAMYLAFFHPLVRYPGPLLARFTDGYAAYHAWKGDIHLDMWRCHQKYGDYVRYGPNKLTFNTAEALRDIYGLGAHSKIVKSDAYAPLVHRAPNTLTIRGGKEHGRRRRIMAQGVSEKAQRGYESRISSHVMKFCDAVFPSRRDANTLSSQREWSEPMDMSKWCYYLSFDIMSDVVFGAKYNLLENPKFRYVTECIDKSNIRMSVLIQIPWLAPLRLDKYLFRDAIVARNRFVKFVSRVVADRLAKQPKLSSTSQDTAKTPSPANKDADVFSNLALARDPETGGRFAPNEIAAESTTLIVAGSDTTSTAFASALFYLADNRAAYDRAAAEVRDGRFASTRDDDIVMGPALASCTYLRACVDEALRMSPPVGLALWREVVGGSAAPQMMVVDGRVVPKGTEVGVPLYAIHHDCKYYRDPFVYRPERWLVEDDNDYDDDAGSSDSKRGSSTSSIERARSVFNPFSLGMRGCLGKGLANTEMVLTLATILLEGDFKFAEGDRGRVGRGRPGNELGRHREGEYQLFDHVTSQKEGPWLQFSRRRDMA